MLLLWCLVGWCVVAVALGLVLGPAIALGSREPVSPRAELRATEQMLTSACGRRFTRLELAAWTAAADHEALRHLVRAPEPVRD